MTLRCLAALVLVGCALDRPGVSVGNPNKNTLLRVGPPGAGIELATADVAVHSVTLVDADGRTEVAPPSATDVLTGVPLGLPGGPVAHRGARARRRLRDHRDGPRGPSWICSSWYRQCR